MSGSGVARELYFGDLSYGSHGARRKDDEDDDDDDMTNINNNNQHCGSKS
jgi:hypothetical protein